MLENEEQNMFSGSCTTELVFLRFIAVCGCLVSFRKHVIIRITDVSWDSSIDVCTDNGLYNIESGSTLVR